MKPVDTGSAPFWTLVPLFLVTPGVPALQAQALMPAEAEARADSLDAAGALEAALGVWESLIRAHPDHPTAGWKAARQAVAIGVMKAPDHSTANEWFQRGEEHARAAVLRNPDDLEALYWLVAAMGKRALHHPPLPTVRLARSVLDSATLILRADSNHAGAHHAIGVLNYEVMTLSRVKRYIARQIVDRRTLGQTSWERAEYHLRRAVTLDPTMLLYQLDLAKLLARRDGEEEARALLRALLATPARHVTDERFQEEARELLDSIRPDG